jgi:hypothetical protein
MILPLLGRWFAAFAARIRFAKACRSAADMTFRACAARSAGPSPLIAALADRGAKPRLRRNEPRPLTAAMAVTPGFGFIEREDEERGFA